MRRTLRPHGIGRIPDIRSSCRLRVVVSQTQIGTASAGNGGNGAAGGHGGNGGQGGLGATTNASTGGKGGNGGRGGDAGSGAGGNGGNSAGIYAPDAAVVDTSDVVSFTTAAAGLGGLQGGVDAMPGLGGRAAPVLRF